MVEKKVNYEEFYIWQEREVRFDISKREISLRKGEKCLDTISNIEDSKGNNGDVGVMMFTNLRIVWFCVENLKLNLSIGYDCILSSEAKQIVTKVSGESMALFIKVKFGNNRFEFVFNAVANPSPQLFNTFTYVIKLYEHTRLYRDVKMKGFLMNEKTVVKLNLEEVLSRVKNVTLITINKAEEVVAANGEFFITNIRVMWFSSLTENYNCSLPWIDIRNIKLKDHQKLGKIICFETNKFFGSQSISIKAQVTNDVVEKIFEELQKNWIIYLDNPILGIWVDRDSKGKIIDKIETKAVPNSNEESSETNKEGTNFNNTNNNNNNNNNTSDNNNNSNTNTSTTTNNTNFNNNNQGQNNMNSVSDGGVHSIQGSVGTNNMNNNMNNNNVNSISNTNNYQYQGNENRVYNKLMKEFPEDIEIVETNFFNEQLTMMSYLSNNQDKTPTIRDIIFKPEIGLAVEKVPNNPTLESIWKLEIK